MIVLRHLQNLIYTDFILMEGRVLCDIPLNQILETHLVQNSTLTCLMKEFDMTKFGKGAKLADAESSDIFGLSSAPENHLREGLNE